MCTCVCVCVVDGFAQIHWRGIWPRASGSCVVHCREIAVRKPAKKCFGITYVYTVTHNRQTQRLTRKHTHTLTHELVCTSYPRMLSDRNSYGAKYSAGRIRSTRGPSYIYIHTHSHTLDTRFMYISLVLAQIQMSQCAPTTCMRCWCGYLLYICLHHRRTHRAHMYSSEVRSFAAWNCCVSR